MFALSWGRGRRQRRAIELRTDGVKRRKKKKKGIWCWDFHRDFAGCLCKYTRELAMALQRVLLSALFLHFASIDCVSGLSQSELLDHGVHQLDELEDLNSVQIRLETPIVFYDQEYDFIYVSFHCTFSLFARLHLLHPRFDESSELSFHHFTHCFHLSNISKRK